MHDFSADNMVVYSNVLIKSVWKMNGPAIKLFAMAVSCIDTQNPPKDLTVRLSKKDIWDMFGLEGVNRGTQFREHIADLQHQSVIIPLDQSGKRVAHVVPVPYVEYGTKEDDDLVIIRFEQAIMPYLLDLRGHFTQFQINQLRGIRGKYAMILFQYLTMTMNVKKAQLKDAYRPDKGVSWNLEVPDLRKMTDTVTDYPQFERFETWVLKKALAEINGVYLPIIWKYEKIKSNRKVTQIRFSVRERQSFSDTEFDRVKPLKASWEEVAIDQTGIVVLSPELEAVFQGKKPEPPADQFTIDDFLLQ